MELARHRNGSPAGDSNRRCAGITRSRRENHRALTWNGRVPSGPARDAGFFENGGGCRARVADQRSRGALQQAGRKQGRRRTLSYDVLIRSAANGRARHSVMQETWKNTRAVIRTKIRVQPKSKLRLITSRRKSSWN